MAERPITSHDVAREAGVSQSAVSRAFTPGASISPTLREKVRAAAARLGYQPNLLPRMMVRGKSGIVALVVGGAYNPHHAATLEAFSNTLQKAGKRIMLVQAESDRALDEVVGDLIGYRIDGVVSALSILSTKAAKAISAHRVPVVTLNSGIRTDYIHVVEIDNVGAGAAAARLMMSSGAKRFAYVGSDTIASRAREEGFCAAVVCAGLAAPVCISGSLDHEGGYKAGVELLRSDSRSDAIFCANDLIAIGVIDALRLEGGLNVPEDAQVVGFDDIPAARWPAYRLTTINQNVSTMAEQALCLLERTGVGMLPPTLVEFNMIIRSSTLHPPEIVTSG